MAQKIAGAKKRYPADSVAESFFASSHAQKFARAQISVRSVSGSKPASQMLQQVLGMIAQQGDRETPVERILWRTGRRWPRPTADDRADHGQPCSNPHSSADGWTVTDDLSSFSEIPVPIGFWTAWTAWTDFAHHCHTAHIRNNHSPRRRIRDKPDGTAF